MTARDDMDTAAHLAELAVIGGLMMFPDLSVVIADNGLTPSHFADDQLRAAYCSICALLETGKVIDTVAVYDDLAARGQRPDLQMLTQAVHQAVSERSLRSGARTLAKAYQRRTLLLALARAAEHAQEATDPADAVDYAQGQLAALQAGIGRTEPRSARDLILERKPYYEQLLRGEHKIDAMPTHLPGLDRALNGGLQRGRLYIVAARPSVGKSSLSIDLGLRAAGDGFPVLFLSLEMPAHEVIDRAVANLGRCSYETLQTGRSASDDDWTGLVDGMDSLTDRPLYIDDQGALTLQHIRAKAHTVKRRGLQILVLDYLQLCSGSGESTRNYELEAITKGLKALAKELDIAIVVLSQLGRDVEKRAGARPQLSDLRDSGAIEQDADVVLFMWRPDQKQEHLIALAAAKNRQGRRAQLLLEFDGNRQRWGQSTESPADHLRSAPQGHRGLD